MKTTTHPALTIVDLGKGSAETIALDKRFSDAGSTRMPHLPSDLSFINGFGYVSPIGADAVFRREFKDGR